MTPEKQRIAIAKICGWKWITPDQMCGYAPWRKQYEGADIPTDGSLPFDCLPDFTSDLNSMHEAENSIKDWPKYVKMLAKVIAGVPNATRAGGTKVIVDNSILIRATAAQRAEAFLRTLNLWTDE